MDLSTLAAVKAVGGISHPNNDAEISAIIAGRSGDLETALDRYVLRGPTYVDTFSVRKAQHVFRLKGYPITSITSVVNDGVTIPASEYSYDALGFLRIGAAYSAAMPVSEALDPLASTKLWGGLIYGPGALVVTYIGGMAVDTAAWRAAYPDLAYHFDLQVLFDLKRKDNLTQKSVAMEGATSSFESMDWLPRLKFGIKRHGRKLPLV